MDFKLEVVVIPVDRCRPRQELLRTARLAAGRRLLADEGFRVIQFTPPGSGVLDHLRRRRHVGHGTGPQRLYLVVTDIVAARDDIAGRGVDISEVFHDAGGVFHHAGTKDRVSGPDPARGDYASFATFSDPDGNTWFLQEINVRLPGR